jgi:hypothetical protein
MSATTRLLIPLFACMIALTGVVVGQAKIGIVLGAVIAGAAFLVSRPLLVAAVAHVSQSWGVAAIAGPNATPYRMLLYLLILQVAHRVTVRRRLERLPVVPAVGLVTLAAIVSASELQSPYGARMQPFEEFGSTLMFVLCLTQVVRSGADVRVFAVFLMLNGLLGGMWGMFEVPWDKMMGDYVVRANGPPGQSNAYGEMMSRAMPFAVAIAADRSNPVWLRTTGATAVAATLYGLFASASRGSTVGYSGALIVFVFGAATALDWPRRIAVLAALGTLTTVAIVSPPKTFEKRVIQSLLGATTARQGDWTSERLDQIKLAQAMIPERPLLGHGSSGFLYRRALMARGRVQPAHSVPLGMATSYGVPAALLHQSLQIGGIVTGMLMARRWRRHRIYALTVSAATAAVLLQALSSSEYFRSQTWSIVALAYLLRLLPDEPQASPEPAPSPLVVRRRLHKPAWARQG